MCIEKQETEIRHGLPCIFQKIQYCAFWISGVRFGVAFIYSLELEAVSRASEVEALVELIRRSASLFDYYAQSDQSRAVVRDLTSAMEQAIDRLNASVPLGPARELPESPEQTSHRYKSG